MVIYFQSKWVRQTQVFAEITIRLEIILQTTPTVYRKLIYTIEVLPYRTM